MTTKAVLFDLDGTLVDTAADLGNAANHVRETLGMAPLPLPSYRQFASAGARGLLRIALDVTPEHPDYAAHRATFLDHYGDNLSRHSNLFDGVEALLSALERRRVRWGIVTNKPRVYTTSLLKDLSLDVRPAVIISADDASKPKPHPDTLLLACERMSLVPSQVIYVGDDKRDADAAQAAGMRFIAVRWGYEGEHPLASWGADATIERPLDLLEHLAGSVEA